MRKKRSDSKLFSLDDAQQAHLAEMLMNGMPYHKAAELIAKPAPEGFGLKVSISAFTPFWNEVCMPLYLKRRSRAVDVAREIGDDAKKRPGQFDAATIDALQQKALELAISPQADPRDVKALYMLVIKAKDQDLETQRLTLDRDKFQFDAAEACLKKLPTLKTIASDNKLDHNEKLTRIRKHLFGELPEESEPDRPKGAKHD